MMRMRVIAVACMFAPALAAQGQQPAPKKPGTGQPIEIRGQAPTPQVVTVRPREVPTYKPASLPGAVMGSGSWPSVTAGYTITQTDQLAGRLPLDTSAAGIARGGQMVGGVAVASAAAHPGGAAGTSATEIEQMRAELAMHKARLDSLQKALHEDDMKKASAGAAAAAGPGKTASDSAARADEIKAIRKELQYRMQRLDSLQKEVNTLGQKPKKAAPAKSDTTKAGGKPPRGRR
jgi:hypothetical protein